MQYAVIPSEAVPESVDWKNTLEEAIKEARKEVGDEAEAEVYVMAFIARVSSSLLVEVRHMDEKEPTR